jgi:hypothetical protein
MSTRKSSRSLTAAVFVLALALTGTTAQADTLFGAGDMSVRASEGFLGQALSWVTEVWTGWFGVAVEKTTAEGSTTTTTQSNSCTPQTPCDPDNEAGWGIDPNG